jgi:hypothetical protein
MTIDFYKFLHVSSVLLLVGGVFYSFAAPQEARKRMLMLTGIAAVVVLFGGFGLLSKIHSNHFYAWVIVKIVAWLGLAGLTGIAFRRREKTGLWVSLAIALSLLSIAMAIFKPGM